MRNNNNSGTGEAIARKLCRFFFLITSSASITSKLLSDRIANKWLCSMTKPVINNLHDTLRLHKQKIQLLCATQQELGRMTGTKGFLLTLSLEQAFSAEELWGCRTGNTELRQPRSSNRTFKVTKIPFLQNPRATHTEVTAAKPSLNCQHLCRVRPQPPAWNFPTFNTRACGGAVNTRWPRSHFSNTGTFERKESLIQG